jgi:hypothetical protein
MQDDFIFIVVGLYRLVARRAETSSPFSGPTLFCNRFARKLTRFDALSDDLAKERELGVHARARSIEYATPEKGSVRPVQRVDRAGEGERTANGSTTVASGL